MKVMRKSIRSSRLSDRAQTVIELSVLGAILIFIVGVIIRQQMSFGYVQNQSLKAARMALSMSYKFSEGILVPDAVPPGEQEHGTSSRNSASILMIEDRLTSDSNKYTAIERNPYVNSASGTYTRNLLQPLDSWENYNLPHFDVVVNGVHFPFRAASFKRIDTVEVDPATGLLVNKYDRFFTTVPNNPFMEDFCDGSSPCNGLDIDSRYGLNRCWDPDMQEHILENGLDPCEPNVVDPSIRRDFAWQWSEIAFNDLEEGDQVDVDFDLQLESVNTILEDRIIVVDTNEGDMDFSISGHDGRPVPGLKDDVYMLTQTNDGTYFFIQEGHVVLGPDPRAPDPSAADDLGAYQFVRTASKKDTVDLVQRTIQLTNDTGRFCQGGSPTSPFDHEPVFKNPVEACGNCFSASNIDKTCFDFDDEGYPLIYIRSRIRDEHGRSWVTDRSSDIYIDTAPCIEIVGDGAGGEKGRPCR